MDDDKKPVVNPAYTVEKFDDEILLYTETGTQTISFNDAAPAVRLLCREDMTAGGIIAYPEQKERIRADVTTALEVPASNKVIGFINAD